MSRHSNKPLREKVLFPNNYFNKHYSYNTRVYYIVRVSDEVKL